MALPRPERGRNSRHSRLLAAALVSAALFGITLPFWSHRLAPVVGPRVIAASGQPSSGLLEPQLSDAEQIARLRRAISASEERLAELQASFQDPKGEYPRAEAAFSELDAKRNELTRTIRDSEPAQRATLQAELDKLEQPWNLAKERFELAIDSQKARREQVVNIELKLRQDREALDRLTHPPDAAESTPAAARPQEPAASVATVPASDSTTSDTPAPTVPAISPTMGLGVPSAGESTAKSSQSEPPAPEKPDSAELSQAREAVRARQDQAKEAESQAKAIAERLEALQRNIDLEHALIVTSRRKVDNAEQTRRSLSEQYEALSLGGGARDELRALADQVHEARDRVTQARTEARGHSDRLDELQTELNSVLAQQLEAARRADEARREVEQAEELVESLQNPFTPRNLLRWTIDHGPKLVAILLTLALCHWLVRIFTRRVVDLMARSGIRGSREEREARASTLVGVFHNAASVGLYVGGTLTILQEIGIPIAPLLGGAAIFGLAVAFGAQNLIRDYFYGFVILLENQYRLNDIVRICGHAGQVEKITLRMTVLRDLEGCVHFIPNGQITSVTNMTHGWSRAQFDVGVAYKENVDRVIEVIQEVGAELRNDSAFKLLILEDLEMLGVNELADSGVVLRFLIKTRTLKQWAVKREMLRRLKNRFDAEGIEIPLPHRTLYHRIDDIGTDQIKNLPGSHLGSREVRGTRERG